jgi:ferredoxin
MKRVIDFYYFTGSGNTQYIVNYAVKVLKKLNIQVNLCSIEKGTELISNSCEIWLAFPVNSQFMSPFIWKFIKSLPRGNGASVNVIATLNESAYVLSPLYSYLKSKDYKPKSSCEISMPNNMVATDFNLEEDQKRITAACDKVEHFIRNTIDGNYLWKSEYKGSKFVSYLSRETLLPWFFMRLMFKLETIPANCKDCGMCESRCPVKNINKINNQYIHNHKCEFCMKCASSCPNKAIKAAGKDNIRFRYTLLE